MSLEDRIRSKVDQVLGTLVQQVLDEAAADREDAIRAAESRVRAEIEQKIAEAIAETREIAEREVRRRVEGEMHLKIDDAVEAVEHRMRLALADGEARAAEELKTAVVAARVKEREMDMAAIGRLLDSVRGLDGATSLSEVLDALALAAAREAARAAVVVLRGDRIQGWKMSGFGARDSQPKSIDLALPQAGVIGLAVGAARAVTTRDSQSAAVGPGFETLPSDRMGLAVPVIVGGRVVAVVYADAVSISGQHEGPVPSCWPELIEVLARHAGRCLEALTTQKTAAPRIPTPGARGAQGVEGPQGAATSGPSALTPVGEGGRPLAGGGATMSGPLV